MEKTSSATRVIATVTSLVLALSITLAPNAAAFASQLESGEASNGGPLSAQSSKSTAYVRVQSGTNLKDAHLRRDYSYNKNGLISRIDFYSPLYTNNGVLYQKIACSYAYNSKGLLTKIKRVNGKVGDYTSVTYDTFTYTYDKNDKPKTCTIKNGNNKPTTTKYHYGKDGTLTMIDNVYADYISENVPAHKYTYPTYNKKGQLISDSTDVMVYRNKKWVKDKWSQTSVYTWDYDSKGNVTKRTDKTYKDVITYKNTYKNGLLTKMRTNGETYFYKYEKVPVPSKFSTLVSEQQNALINPTEYYF